MEKEINNTDTEKIIEECVRELIEKMGFSLEIEMKKIFQDEKENLICNIKTEESNYLIGQYGINLQALQHIARLIIRRKTENLINFTLDVNSYRQEKNDSIINLAKNMANQAIAEKREIVLRPMSSYERRLVHMSLSQNEKIKTESIGEGEDRRIAIKPLT
jgi:spoIIIJ-associated protein